MPPQDIEGRAADQDFAPEEQLFHRVPNTHIENGEINLLAISSELKFDEDPPNNSSFVRSKYAESYLDCLHPNCADTKDLSATHSIWHLVVGQLLKGQGIVPPTPEPILKWDLYPHHDPLPGCYAHSTLCSCRDDQQFVAVNPPKSVRKEFRRWIAENLIESR